MAMCQALKHMVEGALTICFEERISADRRGILELTALRSSHYQFENEPFAKKKGQGSR